MRLVLVFAGVAVLGYLAVELYVVGRVGLPLDDAWIHLHFARQLADGEGLAFNPGHWVSGSTAPLWTAVVSALFLLPGSALVWVKLLGAGLHLAGAHAVDRLAAAFGLRRGLCRLAAVLVAGTPWLVWAALSGMEIPLFVVLACWGMTLHVRERGTADRPVASLPLLALASLTRPEGYLLLAAAAADRGLAAIAGRRDAQRRRRLEGRRTIEGLALAALVLAPVWVFYGIVDGSVLPSTFATKAPWPGDWLPDGLYLQRALTILFASQPVATLLAGAGVVALLVRLGTPEDRGLLPALWVAGLPLAYAVLARPGVPLPLGNFGRYLFPLVPSVVLLAVLGGERLAERLAGVTQPSRRRAAALALLTAWLTPQLWLLARGALLHAQTVANVEDSDVAAARWLADRVPAEALLAAQDVGALKALLPNPVLDLTGIVNPEILPVLRGEPAATEYWEVRLLDYLGDHRPQLLVVFPGSYPFLATRAAGFAKARSFPVPDNVTMAGDELVVYTTPWTAAPLALSMPTEPAGGQH